jgi:uncharacterized repeat protein (TIGR01451 family)
MASNGKRVIVSIGSGIALVAGITAVVMAPVARAEMQPLVSTGVAFGVSSAVSDLAGPLHSLLPLPAFEDEGSLVHPVGDGSYRGPDAAVQSSAQGSGIPPSTHNFEGNDIGDNFGPLSGAPPDTNGDVGRNDYVQIVNQVFSVYDKKTGTRRAGPIAINALWQSAPQAEQFNCTANNPGDPVAQFDPIANRWLISQFGFSESTLFTGQPVPPFDECIAISRTADPTGSYYLYDFNISNTLFEDYPKIGVWPDAYYMTTNQFDATTLEFHSTDACAFERAQMLIGNPNARLVCFDESAFDPGAASGNFVYGGQLPSDLDGNGVGANFSGLPPAGEPNFFMQFLDSTTAGQDKLLEFKFHVDWTNPANSTFGNGKPNGQGTPIEIPVADFSSDLCNYGNDRSCLPQKESSDGLDAIPDRLMNRLAYRNFGDHESLVLNHTVNVGDVSKHAGIRWYEVRDPNGTPTVYQQSTYSPDAEHRWMGSIAMDELGDIALGYSLTSSSRNPAIAYTARLAGDPLNTLDLGQAVLIDGPGSQTDTGNRWGDYSSMSIDPNGCTFWYTQEYYTGTASFQWGTRVGSFTLPVCGDPEISLRSSADLVRVGSDFSYTIGLTTGATGSKTTSVQDILPSGVSLLSVTPSTGTCTGTTTLSCNLGDLPPGDYESISLDVHSATSGDVTNNVSLTTTTAGDSPGNNSASIVTRIYTPCTPPGAVVAPDQTGDTLGSSQQDLQYAAIAEPYFGAGVQKLVFTIKVADLTAPPPNTFWYEHFSYGGVHYFVDMNTGTTPVPTFEYGRVDFDPTTGFTNYSTIGAADGGSTFSSDGTITIVLSNSKLNQYPDMTTGAPPPTAGSVFSAVHGEIQALAGGGGSGFLVTVDSTGSAPYTLSGNAFCAPNTPPTAALQASPTSGEAPLTVAFNASGSSDPDAGDKIASYTFHFGDGSTPVTQTGPRISHTYASAGDYRATLTVTDSRGVESTNVASVDIHVTAPPPPPSADLAVAKTGPATGHVGQQMTYTITVTNNGPSDATGVKLTDTLPKNTGFGSVGSTQGSCSPSPHHRVVTCDIGAMNSGATATVTLLIKPTRKGDFTDTASVSATSPNDPISGNNTSSFTTKVSP